LSLLQDLLQELNRLSQDPTTRVIVLSGNGPAFCAGHDLAEMTGRSADDYETLFRTCSHVMLQLRRMPQPVIAQVHGIATAAGCQLVAACDLAVALETTRFATPGVKIGLFCTTPMVPLVRAIPEKMAMEMLLTGQPISADKALQIGLINRIATEETLPAIVGEYCDVICQSSPLTIQLGKQAFQRQRTMSEAEAYTDAVQVMTDNALKNDAQEGISAFLQKRAPQWTGT